LNELVVHRTMLGIRRCPIVEVHGMGGKRVWSVAQHVLKYGRWWCCCHRGGLRRVVQLLSPLLPLPTLSTVGRSFHWTFSFLWQLFLICHWLTIVEITVPHWNMKRWICAVPSSGRSRKKKKNRIYCKMY
jgi:hypothetical protein